MDDSEYRFLVYQLAGYFSDGTEARYVECYGNSDWTKPTEGPNGAGFISGSMLVETDTGTVFFYDEEDGWVEQFSFIST